MSNFISLGLLLLITLIAVQPQPIPTVSGDRPQWERWDQGLPSFANVQALAVVPGYPAVLYAATYVPPGVWHSTDTGKTWEKEKLGPQDHPVFALLWDPKHERLWAGTERGLLFRPKGSSVWQAIPEFDSPVFDLVLDRDGGMYAVTADRGLLRYDERSDWTCLHGTSRALAVGVSPGGEDLFLGTAGDGLWVSHDGGQNWTQPPGIGDAVVWAITVDPKDGEWIYAHTKRKVYRSLDSGQSWEEVPELDRRSYASTVADDGTLFVGLKGRVARSSDGGQNWEFSGEGLHRRMEVLDTITVGQARDSYLTYAASRHGVYLSRDRGLTWERLEEGPGHKLVETLIWDGREGIIAATPMGLYRRSPTMARWEPLAQEFRFTHVTDISHDAGSQVIYASTGNGLLRSSDRGRTWEKPHSELASHGISGVLVDPKDPDHLFVRLAFERVYESFDAGQSWIARWDGMGTAQVVHSMAFSPEGELWAGTQDGLFRWNSERGSWEREDVPFAGDSVFSLALDASQERQYVGTTGGVWCKQTEGKWQPCAPGEMRHTVTALSELADGHLYAGTKYAGLLHSCDGGTTWNRASGIPVEASVIGLFPDPEESVLYVATDRGLFRGRETNCPGSAPALWQTARASWHDLFLDLNPVLAVAARHFAPKPLPAVHTLRPDDQVLQQARDLGFQQVVQVLSWEETEPTRGEWHWEYPDYLVQAADFYGLDLVVRLDHPPEWARQAPLDPNDYPFDVDMYLRFVDRAVRRYGDAISGYIIWNEPNLAPEWGALPNPAAYTGLLRQAYEIIKKGSPSAVVVSAGLAPTNEQSEEAMDDRIFLEEMYQAGAQSSFDALGAHPYGFAYSPDDPHGAHNGLNVSRLLDLRGVMEAYQDESKPIWVTEIGWTTHGMGEHGWVTVSPEEQSNHLVDAWFKTRNEFPWVEVFTVWNLSLAESEREDEQAGYSLLDKDGTTKPAAESLRKTFAARSLPQHVADWLITSLQMAMPDPDSISALAKDEEVHLGDNE